MKRYRILWLDDDFQPLFDSPTPDQEDINDTREALQYDASKASKYGLEIDRISDFKQFNEKLESVAEYDAVILDLMGLDNQNIDNYEVAADAVERVQENNVIAYVYSANVTEGDIATMFKIPLRKFSASGRCFDKGLGVEALFEKIQMDLADSSACYSGHEECLMLFNDRFLNYELKPQMTKILQCYKDQDEQVVPMNEMRQILESIMQAFYDRGVIDEKKTSLNDRIEYLTEYCLKKDGKIDYKSPVFPYADCLPEIRNTLSFLGKMTQKKSHYQEKVTLSYLLEGETPRAYDILVRGCVYQAFFIIMKWYYGYMNNHRERKTLQ